MEAMTLLQKVRARHQQAVAEIDQDPAISEGKHYVSELFETSGRLLFLCTWRLVAAVLKGMHTGIQTFFDEMASK